MKLIPAADANANRLDVVFSEVAWSGMPVDTFDDWIELHSNTNQNIDLTGWRLHTVATPEVTFSGMIPPDIGFFERLNI